MPQNIFDEVIIGSGDALPSGNKPFPESMLTQIQVTIRRHIVMMGCIRHGYFIRTSGPFY